MENGWKYCWLVIYEMKSYKSTFLAVCNVRKFWNLELIKLGDYYGEKDLQQRCANLLTSCMTVDNVCEIYGHAVKYSAEVRLLKISTNLVF